MTLNLKLQEAIERLSISDVKLKAINAFLSDDFDPEIFEDGERLSFQTVFPTCRSIRNYSGESEGSARQRVVFEMFAGLRVLRPIDKEHDSLTSEEISDLVGATVECHFLVSYDFNGGGELDEECLSLFAQHNVPFNVWPYWREIVQSACGRMGLPRIILPPHRLKKSATMRAEQDRAVQMKGAQ